MWTPLHLGITPWDLAQDQSARWLTEQAVFAEALGFESFFLPESHFGGRGTLPDPLMLLAAVAAATAQIRLGTTSLLLPVRHPLQAAEQVAVLDQLSEGRVILGIGRGYAPALYRAFDVPLKDKRRKFEHCLAIMRRAWRGEPVVEGDGDSPASMLYPLPVQQPEPPLWVAAFGPKALAQAGRLGLPYLASPMETHGVLLENYAQLAVAAREAHQHVPVIVPVMRTVFVSEDQQVLAQVRGLLAAQQLPSLARQLPNERLDERVIVGTQKEVQQQIETYRAAIGMTHLIATRLRVGGIEDERLRRSLRLLAEMKGSL